MASSPNLWYIGVGLEVLATMSGTVGKQLIRLSETIKVKNPRASKLTMVVGLIVNTVLGPLVDVGAYSFAAQSLLAPFGGLDVVWNAMLAPYILQEQLTPRRMLGCFFVLLGIIMAGCFGNHTDAEYTIVYLEETLVNLRVLLYFVVFFIWFLINRLCFMRWPPGSAVRGISLGCTAGTIAGNMFCVKAAVELVKRSIREQEGEIWLTWLPYIMIIGAVFFAVSNVIYMTKGLQEFEALFMITIYEGAMIVSGCVSGAVVLLDVRGLDAWRVILYALSVLIVVLGMYVIFSQEARNRSSLISGSASISIVPSPPLLDEPKFLQRRSFHAACTPDVLAAAPRTHSDPFPVSSGGSWRGEIDPDADFIATVKNTSTADQNPKTHDTPMHPPLCQAANSAPVLIDSIELAIADEPMETSGFEVIGGKFAPGVLTSNEADVCITHEQVFMGSSLGTCCCSSVDRSTVC